MGENGAFEDEDDDEYENEARSRYLLFEAVIGSRPLAVMAWVAAGEDRKVIRDFAASGSLDPVTIPAEKMVIFWTSLGKGPTNSIPEIGFNSLICWKPISASPRATTDPTGTAGIIRLLAVTWSTMPRRRKSPVETYTPLALSE